MKPFVPRFSKRKGAAILAIAALVICLPLGLRALTHETVYVDGSLAYYSVDDLFAGSTLVVSGTITGEPESLRPHPLEHLYSVDSRHPQVEQHGIVDALAKHPLRGIAVLCRVGIDALHSQESLQQVPDVLLVVADKYPHIFSLIPSGSHGTV